MFICVEVHQSVPFSLLPAPRDGDRVEYRFRDEGRKGVPCHRVTDTQLRVRQAFCARIPSRIDSPLACTLENPSQSGDPASTSTVLSFAKSRDLLASPQCSTMCPGSPSIYSMHGLSILGLSRRKPEYRLNSRVEGVDVSDSARVTREGPRDFRVGLDGG